MHVSSDPLDDPVVQALFPFIAFKRDPQKRLLLVTAQKGFRRFFDGETSTNLAGMRDTHYVVFLDEFDFLEAEITDIVCGAPQIEQPFDLGVAILNHSQAAASRARISGRVSG
jgi:hypothetical protein